MAEYQISLSKVLASARTALAMNIEAKRLFFNPPGENFASPHFVPRLLILLDGEQEALICENGRQVYQTLKAPLMQYCASNALLQKRSLMPTRSMSFSFFPHYIRAMEINHDGVNKPPTASDIYCHTSEPLSAEGFQLINLIDSLHSRGLDDAAADLLMPLLRLTIDTMEKSTDAPVKTVGALWGKLCRNLRNHCREPFSRHDLADLLQITPSYVSILCRKNAGKSFSELKLFYQFEHAEKLLFNTNLNIEEIALNCGFNSANYFVRRFKSIYGIPPGAYRNQKTLAAVNSEER